AAAGGCVRRTARATSSPVRRRTRRGRWIPSSYDDLRSQHLQQALDELRRIEDRGEERQYAPRVGMFGELYQGFTDLGIMREPFGAADEPEVQIVFQRADVRGQLGVKSLRIVDQVARMDAEELRQRHAARVGQMPPLTPLDLREIRLADLAPQLLL